MAMRDSVISTWRGFDRGMKLVFSGAAVLLAGCSSGEFTWSFTTTTGLCLRSCRTAMRPRSSIR